MADLKKETRGGRREGTGGAREGSGRKRKAALWSDAFKEKLEKALKAKEKATGQSIHEVMVDMIYDGDTDPRAKTAIYKAITDALVQKSTHKEVDVTDHRNAPVILPARQDDPSTLDYTSLEKATH